MDFDEDRLQLTIDKQELEMLKEIIDTYFDIASKTQEYKHGQQETVSMVRRVAKFGSDLIMDRFRNTGIVKEDVWYVDEAIQPHFNCYLTQAEVKKLVNISFDKGTEVTWDAEEESWVTEEGHHIPDSFIERTS